METAALSQHRNYAVRTRVFRARRPAPAASCRRCSVGPVEALEARQMLSANLVQQTSSGTASGGGTSIQAILTRVAAPTNFTATALSDRRVHLTWTLSTTSGVSGYRVFRSSDGITFTKLATVGSTISNYDDLKVTEATTWIYHVRAVSKSAGVSTDVSATVAVPLAAPTGLGAHPYINVPRVTLSWTDNSSFEAGYVVERSLDGVNFTAIAWLAPNTTTYSDATLRPATHYTYRVRAYGPPADSANSAPAAVTTAAFRVFDGTDFANEPDFSSLGYNKTYLADRQFLSNWSDPTSINETDTRALADTVASMGRILVLDIENLPVDIRTASQSDVQASMALLGQLLDWIHSEQPQLQVGFYGIMPLSDYFAPADYEMALKLAPTQPWWAEQLPLFTQYYQQWVAANAFLAPLAAKVDFVCPSLYTYYDDPTGWQMYATDTIQQARQYGKPVLPYLWMEYHNSTALVGQEIPADYWQMEVNLVRQQADGMVIWGGVKFSATAPPYQEQWDDTAAWWQTIDTLLLAQ